MTSGYSNTTDVINYALDAPTNAKAELDDEAINIVVSWDAVRHAEKYQVYRRRFSDGSYALVADNITTLTWTDLAPLSGYNYYRVKALGHGLTSGYSNTTDAIDIDNSGSIDGRDYVDLGLPSGTLWATCNVGATTPEGYGNYYAWGETTTKSTYDSYREDNYTYSDNPTELPTSADAAYVNWGSGWCMPSLIQFKELINSSYTTNEWTTLNGVNGYKITSKSNGNSIFLPALEGIYEDMESGYWSRTLSFAYGDPRSFAYILDFNCYYITTDGTGFRYCGLFVRPVRLLEQ